MTRMSDDDADVFLNNLAAALCVFDLKGFVSFAIARTADELYNVVSELLTASDISFDATATKRSVEAYFNARKTLFDWLCLLCFTCTTARRADRRSPIVRPSQLLLRAQTAAAQ